MGHDLTPCDLFLWGWLKEQVYSTRPTTLDELEVRIHDVMSSILQEFLVKSVDAVPSWQSSIGLRRWLLLLAHLINFHNEVFCSFGRRSL